MGVRVIATSLLLAGCSSCSVSAPAAAVNDAGADNTRATDAGATKGGSADAGVSPGPAPSDAGTFAPDAGNSEADAGTGPGAGTLDAGVGGLASSVIAGCQMLPANHIFNMPIADQPVSASSADYLATIGATRLRLDTGTDLDQTQAGASDPASAQDVRDVHRGRRPGHVCRRSAQPALGRAYFYGD